MILEILIFFFLSIELIESTDIAIVIKVMEEKSANVVFFSLKNRLRELGYNVDELMFLSRNSLVQVSDDGDISFWEKIDLENICVTKQLCCGVSQCLVNLSILLKNRRTNSLADSIKLQLEIVDKNDNKPEFQRNRVNFQISEMTAVGTSFPLESAVDHDFSTINRILNDTLVDFSNSNAFKIDRTAESNNIFLQLIKQLDFEKETHYNLTLFACDPDFCSNQTIDIQVKDENDNIPKFERSLYNVTIHETAGFGHVLLTVRANDLDKSANYSTIKYKIDFKTIDLNVLSTFKIDPVNGNVILKQQLNAKIRTKYEFQVIARDRDDSGNLDTTNVVVFVHDENNCAPSIDILYPNNGQIQITENQAPQQIAIVSVSDNDLGINSLISCEFPIKADNDNFVLKLKSRDLFTIHSLKQFNYETEQIYFVQIRCRDFGVPSLTTINSLQISILDENEFSPAFTDLHYRGLVRENTPPQMRIMQIRVSDDDKNATLTFRIDNDTESALLTVDSHTGWISTTENNIDRETIQAFSIVIVVKDTLGDDAKSVSTTVQFQVEDENDNKPQFVEAFQFTVYENVPVRTLVGRVWATDADEGGSNILKYSLLKTWSSRQKEINNLFLVKSNGFIDTQGEIDRELDDNFTLLIAVSDGSLTENIVTTNITVTVQDENDNAPIWLVPSFDNAVFNITINYKIGDLILQLVAKDMDASNNGKIQYMIAPNDARNDISSKYFFVNASTGSVFVINHLSESKYQLKFEAIDFGSPVLRTTTFLIIYVYGQEYPILKIAIVASMITVTGIISFFLIVAIICVRNHSIRRQDSTKNDNFNDTDDSLLKSKPSINFVQQSPDFLTLLGNDANSSAQQIPMLSSSHRHINEYLDADSGDSGNGPSEEGLSSQYMSNAKVFMRSMNQQIPNYTSPSLTLGGLYPHSCFSLPENTTIPQFPDDMLDGHAYYDLSATGNFNFSDFLGKYPSQVTKKGGYQMHDFYSQLSQI